MTILQRFARLTRYAVWLVGALLTLCRGGLVQAQLYQPEGLHLPGTWNGYVNLPDPVANYAIRGTNSNNCGGGTNICAFGGVNKWNSATGGTAVWKTTLHAAVSGGDFAGGSYLFVISSGNASNGHVWDNKWVNVNVAMNTLQSYAYNSGPDNSITLVNDNWYTFNWLDIGYGPTKAIFMQTSAAPVGITGLKQTPAPGSVTPSDGVAVSVNLSAPKCPEEIVYVRYSTDNWASSSYLAATGSGTTYTASIPAQANGTTVQYYAFTSTVSASTLSGAANTDVDAYAIRYRTAGGTNGGPAYSYTSASVPPVNITFQVDMQNEVVASGGIHLAGTFNGYNMSAITLSQVGSTSIYQTTIPLPQSASIQYKFINGSSWEDNIASPCSNGGTDRFYTVGTADATIPVTCFSKCGACPVTHPVTFQVDMQNESSVSSVHLAGEFNSWSPTSIPMTLLSGTTYTTTLNLEEGRQYSYKFVDNSANYEDNIPSGPCSSTGGNRTYTVTTSPSQSIPLSCFSNCGACSALSTVTVSVDMQNTSVTNGVALAGTFNGWNTNATQMGRVGSSSIYTATISVPEGSIIQYKFVNGIGSGNFEGNLSAPCGNGSNRTYLVPTGNTTLPAVCFGSCTSCPTTYPITFRVNMAGQTVSGGVSLIGDFNAYSTGANPMVQVGSTTIYETTVRLPAGSHQFKFYNAGGSNGGYENNFGTVCGNGNNRIVVTGYHPATLPVVCYNRCTDCGIPNQWTGLVSADYNNRDNWNAGVVPSGCQEDIQIGLTTHPPSISVGSNFTAGSLTLSNGVLLTIGANANLNLCGNIAGTGTVSGGTITLISAGSQLISGNTVVSDLVVKKTSGVATVTGDLRILGTLSLATATSNLAVVGRVTLASSSTGTARLAPVPAGASLSGALTVERYISNAGWHFVTAPFSSATFLSDFDEARVRISPKNNANIFGYTEGDTTSSRYNNVVLEANGWKVPASLSAPVNPVENPTGYRLYINSNFTGGSSKLVSTGVPFIGDKSALYTFTPGMWDGGGWNLIGNPYPSEIDWLAVRSDAANSGITLSNAYHLWNPVQGAYASYTALSSSVGVAVNGASRYIASSQGFLIKASGTGGSLSFKETHKAASNGNSFLRESPPDNLLRIQLSQGSTSDEAALVFYQDGSEGYDHYDADKLQGDKLNISSLSVVGQDLAINVLPPLTGTKEIPLHFTAIAGRVDLEIAGISSFDAGTRFYIRDAYRGTLTELTPTTASLLIDVTADPASQGTQRLYLIVAPAGVTALHTSEEAPSVSVYPIPAPRDTKLTIAPLHFRGALQIDLSDLQGRIHRTAQSNPDSQTIFSTAGLTAGIYILSVSDGHQSIRRRVLVK